MIEFLSFVYVVGLILLMLYMNLTNALMSASDKEVILILNSIIFWPIAAVYLIAKTIICFLYDILSNIF